MVVRVHVNTTNPGERDLVIDVGGRLRGVAKVSVAEVVRRDLGTIEVPLGSTAKRAFPFPGAGGRILCTAGPLRAKVANAGGKGSLEAEFSGASPFDGEFSVLVDVPGEKPTLAKGRLVVGQAKLRPVKQSPVAAVVGESRTLEWSIPVAKEGATVRVLSGPVVFDSISSHGAGGSMVRLKLDTSEPFEGPIVVEVVQGLAGARVEASSRIEAAVVDLGMVSAIRGVSCEEQLEIGLMPDGSVPKLQASGCEVLGVARRGDKAVVDVRFDTTSTGERPFSLEAGGRAVAKGIIRVVEPSLENLGSLEGIVGQKCSLKVPLESSGSKVLCVEGPIRVKRLHGGCSEISADTSEPCDSSFSFIVVDSGGNATKYWGQARVATVVPVQRLPVIKGEVGVPKQVEVFIPGLDETGLQSRVISGPATVESVQKAPGGLKVGLSVATDSPVSAPVEVELFAGGRRVTLAGRAEITTRSVSVGTVQGYVGLSCEKEFPFDVAEGSDHQVIVTGGEILGVRRDGGQLLVNVRFQSEKEGSRPFQIAVGQKLKASGNVSVGLPRLIAPSRSTGTVPPLKTGIAPTASLPSLLQPKSIDLGEIRATACEETEHIVRMDIPVERRLKMHADLQCDVPGVSLREVRGAGLMAEFVLAIAARRSGTNPFKLLVNAGGGPPLVGEGKFVIDRPKPHILGMSMICGGQTSSACPILDEIPERKEFRAFFEPKLKEFWLSSYKGVIEPGMKEFPFKVFFAPCQPRPIEALLVIDMEDTEICVKVCGSVGGFDGRSWGQRRHV